MLGILCSLILYVSWSSLTETFLETAQDKNKIESDMLATKKGNQLAVVIISQLHLLS